MILEYGPPRLSFLSPTERFIPYLSNPSTTSDTSPIPRYSVYNSLRGSILPLNFPQRRPSRPDRPDKTPQGETSPRSYTKPNVLHPRQPRLRFGSSPTSRRSSDRCARRRPSRATAPPRQRADRAAPATLPERLPGGSYSSLPHFLLPSSFFRFRRACDKREQGGHPGIMPIGSSCARSHVIRGEGHGWGTFAFQSGADNRQVVVAHIHPSPWMYVCVWCSHCPPVPFLIFFLIVLLFC